MSEPLVIFHHVPKTAGSTLFNALREVYTDEEFYVAHGAAKSSEVIGQELNTMPVEQREKIRFVYGHQVWYGIHELFSQPAIYVTFVRNPIARFVSMYYHARRTPEHAFHKYFNEHSLEEIAHDPTYSFPNHLAVYFSRKSVNGHNLEDCRNVTVDTLKQALKNLEQYVFVGLQESFNPEVERLNQVLPRKITLKTSARVAPKSDAESFTALSAETMQKLLTDNWADYAIYTWAVLQNRKHGLVE